MNLNWAYSYETDLPRNALRADADGIMHLDANLLAEIINSDCELADDDDYDIERRLQFRPRAS